MEDLECEEAADSALRRWGLPMQGLVVGLLLAACASAPSAKPEAPASRARAPELLAADAPSATPGGATFTAPAGWSLTTQGSVVVLSPPEADTRIALVDVSAADADTAVAAAWKKFRPRMKRHLRIATDRPARDGWDVHRVYEYDTSPNERAVVVAVARRAGQAWTVALYEGTEMTFEKRTAPINLISESLRPKGYGRESFAGRKPHPLDAERIGQIKALLEKGMQQAGVPGVAFSLIEGGRIVFEGGLGVKELGKPDAVDENTLFIAASNSKALTTLLLAKLVDKGLLDWDEPVTQAYPQFKLGSAETTRQVLVKHLICACTGLPRQDLELIFEFAQASPQSCMELLGTMQPTSKFGEVFQYSNLMVAAAGFIAGHLYHPDLELGAAYDAAMESEIFAPLQMKSTTFDFARAQKGNHARPHGLDIDGKIALGKMDLDYGIVAARPAGGVWTSAHELSQYLMLELSDGKLPSGAQLVSTRNLLARRAPQIQLGDDSSYGMGLIVDHNYGVTVVHHGGDLRGYHSDMIWLPEHAVGAVILTNGDTGWLLPEPFARRLLEVLFDGRPEAVEDLAASARTLREQLAKWRQSLVVPADAALAAKLAPRYRNAALGDVEVKKRGAATVFDFGEWKSEVASRRNFGGSVSFITIEPTLDGYEFLVAEHALVVRDGQHEYVFKEIEPRASR